MWAQPWSDYVVCGDSHNGTSHNVQYFMCDGAIAAVYGGMCVDADVGVCG